MCVFFVNALIVLWIISVLNSSDHEVNAGETRELLVCEWCEIITGPSPS